MITLIVLLVIIGICKAFKDTLLPERKPYSIFKDYGNPFWNKGSGRKTWYGYYWDMWHICDSIALLSIATISALYMPINLVTNDILNFIVNILVYFAIITIPFNLLYGLIFKNN